MKKKKVKMPLLVPKEGDKRGWTEWVFPVNKGFYMACCDCGLVHELDFQAFVETNQKRKDFEVVPLPWPFRVMFKARRRDNIIAT
jgi:hypothetical protein